MIKKVMKAPRSEEREQKIVVAWARKWGLALWFTPNELLNRCTPAQRGRYKAMGVQAGVPDLTIVNRVPGNPQIRAVYLEMKSEIGELSPRQVQVRQVLEREGGHYIAGRGAKRAIEELKKLWPVPIRKS